ncbi:hypothetical protein [Aliiglaciecola sp. M165]|uniref:hypothetical protein n=1 Tax=Aliiglaciecola sp. M165 TaxID=2593649 RepID=UPI0011817594|nr:hypothetical protein [Aliiglaciecola sp. M165]TRY29800.1 hypothetical protein FM019_16650 [Aliiglaciecola sp. M165]
MIRVCPSRKGVYGICQSGVVEPTLADFVYIGRAKSIESRRADYERISLGASANKISSQLHQWLIMNKDFQFFIISEKESEEMLLIKLSLEMGAMLFNR